MFRTTQLHDEITNKIESAMTEIFLEYQTRYNMSGDVEPMQSMIYDESIERLADITQQILQFEYDYFRK